MRSALTTSTPLAREWTERKCIGSSAGWPMVSADWAIILWTRTVSMSMVSNGHFHFALVKSPHSLSYLDISIPLDFQSFFHFLCRLHTSKPGYHHQEWVFSVFINLYYAYDSHVIRITWKSRVQSPFPKLWCETFPWERQHTDIYSSKRGNWLCTKVATILPSTLGNQCIY